MVQTGEAVGVITAQSIGEPGTRAPSVPSTWVVLHPTLQRKPASGAKFTGTIEFEGVRTIDSTDKDGNKVKVVMGRTGEVRIVEKDKNRVLIANNVPYGSFLF